MLYRNTGLIYNCVGVAGKLAIVIGAVGIVATLLGAPLDIAASPDITNFNEKIALLSR